MTRHPFFAAIVLMLGLLVAEAAAAQSPRSFSQADTVTPMTRQRAPGVPMAPRPAEADGLRDPRDRVGADRYRTPRDQQASPQPDRDIPMPKGVPSIMQD